MTQLVVWDEISKRYFETGIEHCVLYPQDKTDGSYPEGVAWNGIVSVAETPGGAEATAMYADNINYFTMVSPETLGGTIEAFYYPDEWGICDGSKSPIEGVHLYQQSRQRFGLSYITKLGNDTEGMDYGYKLHLLYGALAAPSENTHSTVNDSPEATTLSWEYTTVPVPVVDYKPVSSMVIDSTKVDPDKLEALMVILYGTAAVVDPATPAVDARLPLPDEVLEILA